MPASRHHWWCFLFSGLAWITVLRVAVAEDHDGVRFEKGRIDVTLSESPQADSIQTRVRVSFQLRNAGGNPDRTRRVFPIAAPPHWRYAQTPKPWCRVFVGGKPVEIEIKALIDPESRTRAWPNEAQRIEWSRRFEEWFAQDQELLTLIERYRKLNSVQTEMGELTRTFEKRVKRHLIHADELSYVALSVANRGPYFGYLVQLMPEIDPELRIDGKFQRWEFLSLLNDSDPESYRPYEKEWLEKVDRWFASKPDLHELIPKLRELWGSFREGQELLNGPILKHLHDVNGLSLPVAVQVQSLIGQGNNTPPTELARQFFPDVGRQLEKEAKATSLLFRKWGFDESVVSPFTGTLMPVEADRNDIYRDLWRDETVLAALGRPKASVPFRQRNRQDSLAPVLISFEAPLNAGSTVSVVIEYDTQVQPPLHPLNSAIRLGGGVSELATVFPSPRDVAVFVTCPARIQPVITPAPRTVEILEDGARRFEARLSGEESMLHLVALDFQRDSHAWTGRFSESDSRVLSDLEVLIEKTKNLTVRPLLMTALYSVLLQRQEAWNAHQLARRILREHPDFAGLLEAAQGNGHEARQARELYEWIEAKIRSPKIETEDDFKRFLDQSSGDSHIVTGAALKELAGSVQSLDEAKLNLHEKMGRRFILCQAEVDTQDNLAGLLALASAHPDEAILSLKLLQFLSVEKSAALPFVVSQIDVDLRAKARAGKVKSDSFEWIRQNQAYYAMGTFDSPKSAKQLIEFVHGTDDGLLIQGAMTALSKMTLPDLFDELTGISEKIASSSESAYIQYLDLLLRSNQQRAVPFLEGLAEKHPQLSRRVMTAPGRSGIQMALPQAIAIYRNSDDIEGDLVSAATVLSEMAGPEDIAALEYRKGLPEWMNERLVSVIRFKGGDETVFPFVEAYYNEFVRGRKKHNHLTCVAAFEEIGDARAVPYLREIFNTTERKRDAAHALGNLLLDRRIKRARVADDSMDRSLRAITQEGSTEQEIAAAWKSLLAEPDAAFRRLMLSYPLRSALEDSDSEWTEDDQARVKFIARFGDVAARHLLAESDGCSLHQRYRIAKLLTVLLPDSEKLIEAAAADDSADTDRRRTAQLALRLASMDDSAERR